VFVVEISPKEKRFAQQVVGKLYGNFVFVVANNNESLERRRQKFIKHIITQNKLNAV
jgi:hypothetical protein